MSWMSARSSRAPWSHSTAKRAPATLAARSKSRMPSAGPSSQCGWGVKSKTRGVPTRRASTLACASVTGRHRASGRFGTPSRLRWIASSVDWSVPSSSLTVSATSFISALSAPVSSPARPRLAMSSPTTRCRWRSCSTRWRVDRRSWSSAQGSASRSACSASPPRRRSRSSTCSFSSTTRFRSSTDVAPSKRTRRIARPIAVLASADAQGSQGRLPRRRAGHALPARHQGAAQGDAAARRQADHPVRRRGSGGGRPDQHHHRHRPGEERDRGPLRRLLRAGEPAGGAREDGPAGAGARASPT